MSLQRVFLTLQTEYIDKKQNLDVNLRQNMTLIVIWQEKNTTSAKISISIDTEQNPT